MRRIKIDVALDDRERCAQFVTDICQKTLLGGKKRFQAFQRLVEGLDQAANLVVLRGPSYGMRRARSSARLICSTLFR
jgi:hypothetical protein